MSAAAMPNLTETRPADPRERLVMAKELVDLFAANGITISYRYARALVAQCPQTVRRRYVRFSDAWAWWRENPHFQPFTGLWSTRRPAPKKKRKR
jgi:hypothetical protein